MNRTNVVGRNGTRVFACVTAVALLACNTNAKKSTERVAAARSALACRQVTMVATKTYASDGSTTTTDAIVNAPGGMGLAIPATLAVTLGGAGTGSATLAFRALGASADTACTYAASAPTTYKLTSCSDGSVANAVVTATTVTIDIVDGDPNDPAGEADVTFTWVEATSCDGVVIADAAADVTTHDADAASEAAPDDAADAAPACVPANCDDGNPCTIDVCKAGTCLHVNATDGTACSGTNKCNQVYACQAGACTGSKPVVCVAIDQCHSVGTCDTTTGLCSNPAKADGTACNDGNACTRSDACLAGACSGSNPVQCTASDQCHDVGTCDTGTGVCSNPAKADGTACNDGNACTRTDTCSGGACSGSNLVVCAPTDACHTSGTCDTTTGACSNPPVAVGTACADNSNKCVGAQTCSAAGTCVQAAAPVVDDGNPCTLDSCDPATGVAHVTIPGCGPTTDRWAPIAGRPGPRDGAASAFDAMGNSLILFGGENAGASIGDTWTLDRATGRWSVAYTGGPDARAAAAVAFDSVRRRVVLFGGISRTTSGDTFLADTWEYDPVAKTWAVRASATAPAARAYATALFDSVRRRVVVFGGRSASGAADNGDIWEWDGTQWSRRAVTGAPPARSASSSVHDVARNRYVLFGGETVLGPSLGVALDDTWELDTGTATWTSVTPSQRPPARLGHAMYFDAARAKVVAFGGTSATLLALGDTWEYDGAAQTWANRAPTASPSPRAGHALAYDPTTTHALLVGGVTYSSTGQHTPNLDDTWELDGASGIWTPRTADGAPALYRGGVVYDSARKTLVLRGDEARPAMWELAAGRWIAKDMLAGMNNDYGASFAFGLQGRTGGQERRELARSALVFDSTRSRTLYLAAGSPADSGVVTGTPTPAQPPSLWEWDGARWTSRTCNGGPLDLERAVIAFDGARGRVVVAGGTSSVTGSAFGTWEVDPTTCVWTVRTSVALPPSRVDAQAVWDSARSVVVMYGGSPPAGGAPLRDTWEWDGAAGTWTQRSIGVAPDARSLAGMAFDAGRQRVVLFGGLVGQVQGGTYLADTWEYDGATWSSKATTGPSARMGGALAFDAERAKVVLFGGSGADGAALADLWDWDGVTWKQRALGAAPFARSGASGGWIPQRGLAVIFGGVRGDGERAYLQETWVWKGGEWTTPSTARANDAPSQLGQFSELTPSPRAGHAFAVGIENGPGQSGVGLLFGGESDVGLLSDTWTWNDQTFAWTPVTSSTTPVARSGHAMVALPGRGYLLFGGTGSNKSALGDTYVWTQANGWATQAQFGATPPARTMIAMATDPVRRKVVLFGGRGASGSLQDTWEYDIDGTSGWRQRTASFNPPARFGHAMFYDSARDTVVMLGGTGDDPSSTFGDAWEWDGAAGTWSILPATTSFEPRAGAVAFFDAARGQSVVFGGLAYRQAGAAVVTYGDTWAFTRANEKHRSGIACSDATGCASGFCVDGYCCGSACSGQCGACDLPGSLGVCTAVSGAPHGSRTACGGSGVCAAQCNGTDVAACHPAAIGTVCGAGSCSFGTVYASSTCDAQGTCQPGASSDCAPYICGPSGACRTSCTLDGQCAGGAFCVQTADSANFPNTCATYARIASFTPSPSPGKVGAPVTLSATTSAGTNVLYTFTYQAPGSSFSSVCGYVNSPNTSCSFTPSVAGTYVLNVSARAGGSQKNGGGGDDFQTINLTVTP